MVDISNSTWDEIDNSNISPSPNGLQIGDSPNAVAEVIRATRGAIKRNYVRSNGIYTSTGSANAYVLTFMQAPDGYVKGEVLWFFSHAANTGPATLDINGLGSKAILQHDGTALLSGQIPNATVICLVYDGANFRLQTNNTNPKFNGTLKADVFSGSFSGAVVGNGSGITDINANNITTGTISNSLISGSYNGITTLDLSGMLTVKTIGEAIRVISSNDTDDVYLSFNRTVSGSVDRKAKIIHTSGTGDGYGLALVNEANASDYALVIQNNGTLKFYDGTAYRTLWHQANDGSGSGLDADLIRGMAPSTTLAGNSLVARDSVGDIFVAKIHTESNGASQNIRIGDDVWIGDNNLGSGMRIMGVTDSTSGYIQFGNSSSLLGVTASYAGGSLTWGGNKIWHAGNDGAGSGLDADVVRGLAPDFGTTAGTIPTRGTNGEINASYIYNPSNGTTFNWDGNVIGPAYGGLWITDYINSKVNNRGSTLINVSSQTYVTISVPTTSKRIRLRMIAVRNGSNNNRRYTIQLGTSSGFKESGYSGGSKTVFSTNATTAYVTEPTESNVSGSVLIEKVPQSDDWVITSTYGSSYSSELTSTSGWTVNLGANITQLRFFNEAFTTINSGWISVEWEY